MDVSTSALSALAIKETYQGSASISGFAAPRSFEGSGIAALLIAAVLAIWDREDALVFVENSTIG